jgi:hypothetical protein
VTDGPSKRGLEHNLRVVRRSDIRVRPIQGPAFHEALVTLRATRPELTERQAAEQTTDERPIRRPILANLFSMGQDRPKYNVGYNVGLPLNA